MYFNFNEINILIQNLRSPELHLFFEQLSVLRSHTTDMVLKSSIQRLEQKLYLLSEEEFRRLYEDISAGNIVTTEGYHLPVPDALDSFGRYPS